MSKWPMVKLGDVFNITSGGTPSRDKKEYWDNATIPWVKTGNLKDRYLIETDEMISHFGIQNSAAKVFPPRTVLVAMYGATIGACSILTIEASSNQACAAFLPSERVYPEYLYYWLNNNKQNFIKDGVGGAQPNISATYLKERRIPLPPLEEQRRIAAMLDKAQSLIDLRKKQIAEMDVLAKAKFIEMFGDPVTNPMGWDKGTIRETILDVKYGTSRPANEGGKYKYLRMGNITYDGHLDISDLKCIDIPDAEVDKYLVRKGDVLFNRTNSKELVGKTCVFNLDEPMIIAGYIIRVRTNDRVLPLYLSMVLNSQYGKKTLADMCKAIVGQANINAQELQDISILIPPRFLQDVFSTLVGQIEKLKSAKQKALDQMETLYSALMQQAFS